VGNRPIRRRWERKKEDEEVGRVERGRRSRRRTDKVSI